MSNPALGTSVPSIFSFEEKQLRVIVIDDEPWFVAADVCAILNLGNPTKTVSALDEDEHTLTLIQGVDHKERQANIINESGLYTLILRCRDAVKSGCLPHRFRKKVTSEILPAIRKTGRYEATSSPNPMSDEALTNLRLSNPQGQWRLTFCPDGRAHLQQIARYSLLVEPKYLFKLLDAARDIQAFVEYFGLEPHYAPLRAPCDLQSKARVRTETIPQPRSSLK